jgi:large subunit ribosomal protein L18
MMNQSQARRLKRKARIHLSLLGTQERPRVIIHRSLKHLNAEAINDSASKIIFGLSSLDKEIRSKFPSAGNVKSAVFFGEVFARRAKEKGISKIIFDRAGYLYHGRVKAFAESLRKHGLEF